MPLNKNILSTAIFSILLLNSCDRFWGGGNTVPEGEIQIVNNWIWNNMNDVYLWEEYLPDLAWEDQSDPEQYFYDLLYPQDEFSYINDNYEEFVASLDGISVSTGMSAQPVLYTDNDVVSYVRYVVPNSPAARAGLKRGDMFLSINGDELTRTNYYDLYYEDPITIGLATWNGNNFVYTGEEVTLVGETINENPVHLSRVIDYGGQLTAYMVFNSFTFGENNEWLQSLNLAFEGFKSEGVSDVIIDLRYNGGGYGSVARYMAGVLAPLSVSQNMEIFQIQIWNDLLTEFWKDTDLDDDGKADGDESIQLVERFEETDVNLNLNRAYFLTTGSTASASESLMIGLYPYMDEVIQIGTTTVGKCYGSIIIGDNDDPPRHNWVMLPLVLKYANADGYTDFVSGLVPDIEVREDFRDLQPFGSLQDPLLARALEEITGQAVPGKKSTQSLEGFEILAEPQTPRIERVDDTVLRHLSESSF